MKSNMDWLITDLKVQGISIESGRLACRSHCEEMDLEYTPDMKYWVELSWSNFYDLSDEDWNKQINAGQCVDFAVNTFGSSPDDAINNAVKFFWERVDEGSHGALEAVSILKIKRHHEN